MGRYSNSGLGSGTSGAGQISTEQQEYGNDFRRIQERVKERRNSRYF